MVYGTYNYSYWGESRPTNITGGPHIVYLVIALSILISNSLKLRLIIGYDFP